MPKYCPDKYKTKEMGDKAVDSCLFASIFVPDWFVTNNMVKKLNISVFLMTRYRLW